MKFLMPWIRFQIAVTLIGSGSLAAAPSTWEIIRTLLPKIVVNGQQRISGAVWRCDEVMGYLADGRLSLESQVIDSKTSWMNLIAAAKKREITLWTGDWYDTVPPYVFPQTPTPMIVDAVAEDGTATIRFKRYPKDDHYETVMIKPRKYEGLFIAGKHGIRAFLGISTLDNYSEGGRGGELYLGIDDSILRDFQNAVEQDSKYAPSDIHGRLKAFGMAIREKVSKAKIENQNGSTLLWADLGTHLHTCNPDCKLASGIAYVLAAGVMGSKAYHRQGPNHVFTVVVDEQGKEWIVDPAFNILAQVVITKRADSDSRELTFPVLETLDGRKFPGRRLPELLYGVYSQAYLLPLWHNDLRAERLTPVPTIGPTQLNISFPETPLRRPKEALRAHDQAPP